MKKGLLERAVDYYLTKVPDAFKVLVIVMLAALLMAVALS